MARQGARHYVFDRGSQPPPRGALAAVADHGRRRLVDARLQPVTERRQVVFDVGGVWQSGDFEDQRVGKSFRRQDSAKIRLQLTAAVTVQAERFPIPFVQQERDGPLLPLLQNPACRTQDFIFSGEVTNRTRSAACTRRVVRSLCCSLTLSMSGVSTRTLCRSSSRRWRTSSVSC